MSWTGPEEIRSQVERLWERGAILGARLRGEALFPIRLRSSRPDPRDLSRRFDEVRKWIKTLEAGSKAALGHGYEIEWAEVEHRQLGRNRIPAALVIPTEQDALALVGKRRQAELASELAAKSRAVFPELAAWSGDNGMKILEHARAWERVLAVLAWFRSHPRSGLYLRQIDVPGVDTKFVEGRRELFTELLDLVLPADAIDPSAVGASAFERRYGLKTKPALVRFRVLDERLRIGGLEDLSVPDSEFAHLAIGARRVFVTENKVNGLAFPYVPESIVVFGLGYRVDRLSQFAWLHQKDLIYWGDIDTHGFAILDLLRHGFENARSLMMDRETLLAHRDLWGREDDRAVARLDCLTAPERELYDDLLSDGLGDHLRLEQERIGFGWVQQAVRAVLEGCELTSVRGG